MPDSAWAYPYHFYNTTSITLLTNPSPALLRAKTRYSRVLAFGLAGEGDFRVQRGVGDGPVAVRQ